MDTLPPLPPPPPPVHSPAQPPLPPQQPAHPPLAPDPHRDANLDRELPTVLQDLVPLSYLIDRTVAQAYLDLANLAETLPSQNDQARKRAVVDYVLHTRRQILKLLVLTRWSTEADRIGKAMNIIGFLSQQNHALESTVTSLTDTTSMLSGARVRNYDLSTALAVLTSGTYPALPSAVREAFDNEHRLEDAEVLETLREVDDVLRWRIVMGEEHLPPALQAAAYRIADGRVTFTLPGLWEASFTYGGDNTQDDAEWYLLGIRFLFRVKDARGVWSSTPLGPMKDHLIALCNATLLRRPALPPPFQPAPPAPAVTEQSVQPAALADVGDVDAPEPVAETEEEREEKWRREREEVVRKRRRDRPLNRAYTFLQRLALSYQLEAVYAQAVQLAATGWSGSLKVEMSGERDEVRVEYWSPPPEKASTSAAKQPARSAGPGGAVVFSLRPSAPPSSTAPAPSSSSSRTSAREQALQAALAAASHSLSASSAPSFAGLLRGSSAAPAAPSASTPAPADPSSSSFPDSPPDPSVPPALSITWLTPPGALHPSTLPSAEAAGVLSLGADLDVERVMRGVVRRHAADTVRMLGEAVGATEGGGEGEARVVYPPRTEERRARRVEDAMQLDGAGAGEHKEEEGVGDGDDDRVPYVHFALHGPRALAAHINPLTGHFELRAAPPLSSSSALSSSATAAAQPETHSAARDTRLRVATERIDRERFNPPGAPPGGKEEKGKGKEKESAAAVEREKEAERGRQWMKGVRDVVARIRASTLLDDLETLSALLSLPPSTRRLPIPPRELAKFGPRVGSAQALASGRSGFVFVPLSRAAAGGAGAGAGGGVGVAVGEGERTGLEGFWLVLALFDGEGEGAGAEAGEGGLRAALVRTRDATDGATSWLEVDEVGWLAAPSSTGGPQPRDCSALGFDLAPATLAALWRQAVHRVALVKVEAQLQARGIAFSVTPGEDGAEPYLVVQAGDLVRAPAGEAGREEVAFPNVPVQCVLDEEGVPRVALHARFRFPPSSTSSSPGAVESGRPDPSTLPPNVLYNRKRDVFVFLAVGDLDASVEKLLRAYALVAHTVHLAQQAHARASSAAIAAKPPSSPEKKPVPAPASAARPQVNGAPERAPPAQNGESKKGPLKIVNGIGVRPFG
ncbi:hypothetical protein JCM10207_001982 [Rhodosporidiobolus poonsookiae]